MKSSITNRLNIAYYELRLANEIVDRMMPYLIFPTALYSLGLVQKRGLIRVTCNANPWQKSNKISLGSLFKEFGGGGHQDVGSALFSESEYNTAKLVLDSIFARVSGKVKQSRGRQHG